MSGYLIAEEGPLAGMTIAFEEGKEDNAWSLGRDPEESDILLEDPMVSRKHAEIRKTAEGFELENFSTVNPVTQNGMVVADPVLLKEGDVLQIGSTFFRYTEKEPLPAEEEEALKPGEVFAEAEEGAAPPSELHFGPETETRWLLKVISGPNAGAEFAMHGGETYLIGKDANICDVVFQDLSVSRQHARISISDDENAFIEDLGSRNGVIVNGELISEKQLLASQDLVALGTTTFLVVDRKEARETIISPAAVMPRVPSEAEKKQAALEERHKRDWKEIIIPKRHLVMAGVFVAVLFVSVFGMISLFKTQPVQVAMLDENEKIRDSLSKFPGVEFAFNRSNGKIFLTGNVMTNVNHQEVLYILNELPFVHEVDDNVIVDELVWKNMNSLLSSNPKWGAVAVYGLSPGKYALRGYVETVDIAEELIDYVNLNFDYLDRLENQIVVEKNLQIEVESLLIEKGFAGVRFELSGGEVVLTGRVESESERALDKLVREFQEIPGIRIVKNFVVVAKDSDASRIDLTPKFQITGFSKGNDQDIFVVINGRILGQGDVLDGMKITKIKPKMILLEKEGLKYKIDYSIH